MERFAVTYHAEDQFRKRVDAHPERPLRDLLLDLMLHAWLEGPGHGGAYTTRYNGQVLILAMQRDTGNADIVLTTVYWHHHVHQHQREERKLRRRWARGRAASEERTE